jgi:hypothetical protein
LSQDGEKAGGTSSEPSSSCLRKPHCPAYSPKYLEGAFSEVRLHDLPAVEHAADEKRLERTCRGSYPLLYAMHGTI